MRRVGLILGLALLGSCSSDGANGPLNSAGAAAAGASGASEQAAGSSGVTSAAGTGTLAGAGTGFGGAGGSADSSGTAGAAGCNSLVNSAPVIQELGMKGMPPTPTGGSIADGTYYETSYLVYGGSTDPMPKSVSHQLTAKIQGSLFQAVFQNDMRAEERITLQLTPSGTTLGELQTCRTNGAPMMVQLNVLGYDATPTAFTIHLLQDQIGNYVVYTLTKQ